MKRIFAGCLAFAALISFNAFPGERAHAETTYSAEKLGVPGAIEFAGKSYELAWAGTPQENFTVYEYVPAGQKVETYTDMLLINIASGLTVADAVAARVGQLDSRKGSDPVLRYELLRNEQSGETILDFLLSDKSSGTLVVEWNGYRYIPVKKSDGSAAILMMGISRRNYGDNPADFFQRLKANRLLDINTLAKHAIPEFAAAK
jgi:hypothetical protein